MLCRGFRKKLDGNSITKAVVHPKASATECNVKDDKAFVTINKPTLFTVDINGQMDDQDTGSLFSAGIKLVATPKASRERSMDMDVQYRLDNPNARERDPKVPDPVTGESRIPADKPPYMTYANWDFSWNRQPNPDRITLNSNLRLSPGPASSSSATAIEKASYPWRR